MEDIQIFDNIKALDSTITFKPFFKTAQFISDSFESNHAGRKGSALFIKGITNFKITSSTFTLNKAVDVIQEINLMPAYAKFLLNADTNDLSNYRPFSFHVPEELVAKCGRSEIEYLARCATSKTFIP